MTLSADLYAFKVDRFLGEQSLRDFAALEVTFDHMNSVYQTYGQRLIMDRSIKKYELLTNQMGVICGVNLLYQEQNAKTY